MTNALKNKTALITGATRGIGRAVALAMAQEGAHVVALAKTKSALENLDDEIQALGGTCTLLPFNLSKLADIDKIGPSLAQQLGRLDIFIGNAGILGPLTPVHQIEPKEWEKVMNINLHANTRLIRTLDPLLRSAPAGRVIFTTSGAANAGRAYFGPYAASKAALNAFAKIYAAETAQTNMRVNLVSPGAVDTDMLDKAFPGGFQDGITRKPEDVALLYLDLASESCTKHGEIVSPEN